jgi:hypothetical protein
MEIVLIGGELIIVGADVDASSLARVAVFTHVQVAGVGRFQLIKSAIFSPTTE